MDYVVLYFIKKTQILFFIRYTTLTHSLYFVILCINLRAYTVSAYYLNTGDVSGTQIVVRITFVHTQQCAACVPYFVCSWFVCSACRSTEGYTFVPSCRKSSARQS